MTESQQGKKNERAAVVKDKAATQDHAQDHAQDHGQSSTDMNSGQENPTAPDSSGGGGFMAFLALIVAGGVAVAGYLFWQENTADLQRLDQRFVSLEQAGSGSSALSDRQGKIESELGALQSGIDSQIATRLSPLESAITELRSVAKQSADTADNVPGQAALQASLAGVQSLVQEMKNDSDAWLRKSDWSSAKTGIDTQINTVAESIKTLSGQVNALQTQLAQGTDKGLLMDAAHLLRVANDRLYFDHNPQVASEALDQARARLKQSQNRGLSNVIGLIDDGLARLKAIKTPDISALSVDLIALQHQVANLPQPQPGRRSAPGLVAGNGHGALQSVRAFFSDMWLKIKGLVTIRRRGSEDVPLRSPEQQQFLVENTRIKLETARLALLRRDDANYHASLADVRDWLGRYYAVGSDAIAGVTTVLDRLEAENINPPLPDISAALTSLMKVMHDQGLALLDGAHTGGVRS